jgi:hypothetical protein
MSSFQKYFLSLLKKCQNGSARHKLPKSAVMFASKDLKLGTATIKVPDGFSNRFNSFICLSKLGRVLKHAT